MDKMFVIITYISSVPDTLPPLTTEVVKRDENQCRRELEPGVGPGLPELQHALSIGEEEHHSAHLEECLVHLQLGQTPREPLDHWECCHLSQVHAGPERLQVGREVVWVDTMT